MTRARDLSSILAADGSLNISTSVNLADNEKAYFGTSNDLQIYHDGSQSFIDDAGTGSFYIRSNKLYIQKYTGESMAIFTSDGAVDLRYDDSQKLVTTATGVDVTGTVTMDGASTSGDITFGDNNKAIFGAGSDLQIYHNGTSASYITDQGTGNLVLGGDIAIILQNSAHDANMLDAYNGGRVGLYHANSLKLATTATGVDITGVITTDGLTTSADITFGDNDKAIFGAGSDLQIYHDGSHSYIDEQGTGNLRLRGSNFVQILDAAGNDMIQAEAGNSVQLYHNASAKLATTATGAQINGQLNLENADGAIVTGVKATKFGYSSAYRVTQVGDTSGNNSVSIAYDPSTNTSGSFSGTGHEVLFRNGVEFITPNSGNTGFHNDVMRFQDGNVGIGGNPAHKLHIFGNGSQLNFNDSNSRITFAGYRALEGNTAGTLLQVGEGYTDITLQGRVTMTNQPSFSCYKNGTLTETSGYTRVGSWTENHDQGGHFDNSTGRFTAPVSGKYLFAFSAMHSGNVNGDVQFSIYRNGSQYQGSNDTADGGSWDQCTVVAVVAMSANDYVEPYAYSNITSTREVVYSGKYSGWHGYLIG